MYFKHKLLGFLFNIFKILPLKKEQISFIIDNSNSFNLNYENLIKEFKKHNSNFNFKFFIKNKPTISSLLNLARSKYIFLDDNYFPIAFMNFKKETEIIQLWHAPGAFKKFGYLSLESESRKKLLKIIGEKISLLSVTSKNMIPFYSEAFQIKEDKIKDFGFPKLDYYNGDRLKESNIFKLKKEFVEKYPEAKDKKIILYAPTFREKMEYNEIFNFLGYDEFKKRLGNDYILAVRLHPKINKFLDNNSSMFKILESKNIINLTGDSNEQNLLLVSDILVTDYSSIMIEFSFLNKPTIFFAYDLDDYINEERGFYFNYLDTVPGPVVFNSDELIDSIENLKFDVSKLNEFNDFEFTNKDVNSSKRIVDYLINR